MKTPAQVLREFADQLDKIRPSEAQQQMGDKSFNDGTINGLKFAAKKARMLAQDEDDKNQPGQNR